MRVPLFYAKILLFGEYGIIENSQNKETSVEKNNEWHTEQDFKNNSGEKTKLF